MKRILYSISGIVVVAAVVIASTGAFFSDTETSTGNVFTAGAIDLQIDSQQHYNGNVCVPNVGAPGYHWQGNAAYPVPNTVCTGSWVLQDLGNGDVASPKFFSFGDIKPGDEGENTISLHVINNDAWVCAAVANLTNDDNGLTEPEGLVDTTAGAGEGELQQKMVWTVWRDDGAGNGVAGDNIQNGTEQTLASGHPVNGTLALYDSTTETGPLPGGTTGYIGVSWSLPGATGNEVQTDSMTGDISFSVVQSRNNTDFVCGRSQTERPTVGANLSAYVAPTICDITVDDNGDFSDSPTQDHTINGGITKASTGQTVCVAAGTYNEDVNVNKDITLSGGALNTSTINGVGTGEAGALVISANGATVEGFNVIGAGVSAIRISGARDGVTVRYNHATAATGKNAFLTDGGQSNHIISNNLFDGAASQLVYVNGNASVATPSTNVDFVSNTFGGTATGPLLGMEANGSSITLNKFSGTTGYTSIETFEGNNLVNQNNFNVVGQMHVTNGVAGGTQFPGTLNAENNWWGDLNPADNVTGLVDFTPSEASALPQN